MDHKELEKWLRNEELRAYAAWPQEVREVFEKVPVEHKRLLTQGGPTVTGEQWSKMSLCSHHGSAIYSISPDYHLPGKRIRWCKIEGQWYYDQNGTKTSIGLAVRNGAIGYRSDKYPNAIMSTPVMYSCNGELYPACNQGGIDSGEVEIVRADWVGFEANP